MSWKDLYPELVNKIRWAIVSSSPSAGDNISYQEAQHLATVISQDVIAIWKTHATSPKVLGSTTTVRDFYKQDAILAEMDKTWDEAGVDS